MFFDFIVRHCRMLAMGTTPFDSTAAANTGASNTEVADAAAAFEEQRAHLRFDKMFVVRLESLLFGESYCVARNVSAGGIFLELPDPLPLGSVVRVCFPVPDGSGDVVATGEVKNHYFINYTQGGTSRAVAGMAVRFTSFENESHHVLADCLSRMRVLH
jgi:hypothetical protein